MLSNHTSKRTGTEERARAWATHEVHLLARLWAQGLTTGEITAHMDGRNENSIAIKATRIGLSRHRGAASPKTRGYAKIRQFLTCQQPFISEGKHNRRCDSGMALDDGWNIDPIVHGRVREHGTKKRRD